MSLFTTSVTGSIWTRVTDTVTASSSKDLLSLPDSFCSVTLYLNVTNGTLAKVSNYVVNLKASGVKWTSNSIVGSGLDYTVNFTVAAGTFTMSLTNNESFDLSTDVVRLELGL